MSLKKRLILYSFASAVLTLISVGIGIFIYINIENNSRAERFFKRVVLVYKNTEKLIGNQSNPLDTIYKVVSHVDATLETSSVIFFKRDKVREYIENYERFLEGKFVIGDYIVNSNYKPEFLMEIIRVDSYGVIGESFRPTVVAKYPLIINGEQLGKVFFLKKINYNMAIIGFLFIYPLLAVAVYMFPLYRLVARLVREIKFLKTLSQDVSKNQFSKIELLRQNLRLTGNKDDEIYELKVSILKMMESLEKLLLKTTREKIHYEIMALTDSLTKLYNRRIFIEVAEKELSRASKFGDSFSIILLDIDNFKKINDTYGHDVGDIVLRTVAEVLKKNVRKMDMVVRWGGEEFIVMLPNTNLKNAVKVAEKLRKLIERTKMKLPSGEVINITVSVGVSSFKGQRSLDEIIKEADIALYTAKSRGKNRVEIFRKSSSF
ncbi:MAG TPA: diguanylate cyclase [Aquifex aeolicus]|nr:diguanylate cyclase [Aquifex aeolicus]